MEAPIILDKGKELEYMKEKIRLLEAQLKLSKIKKRYSLNEAKRTPKRNKPNPCLSHKESERCNFCTQFTLAKKSFKISVPMAKFVKKAEEQMENVLHARVDMLRYPGDVINARILRDFRKEDSMK